MSILLLRGQYQLCEGPPNTNVQGRY
ncbi:hypothetical protein Hamer_G027233 [Homarus americanus]|uniref:Uncharacterized protein n=1 Tax=Homarus americanus TaxID=6706 RepID=A0A8J5NBW8_HOMAM|nr:hypothetical protein Hamer_G027233 [Homarus americanus]